jgi:pilus assembly protein CpaD
MYPLPKSFAGWRAARIAVRIIAVLGCSATLAGCFTTMPVPSGVANDYRLRHPIAIKEGVRTVELFIGSKRGSLSAAQQGDVSAFAGAWRREATGGILIEVPAMTRNEIAAANAVAEIRSLFLAIGVPARGIEVRPYRPADPTRIATIRLNYPTMTAEAGPCGLWPHDLGPTADREHNENVQYWNLGCASQRNFAAMVENKADLVQPRGETPPNTGRRANVLDKYRRGESPSTVYPEEVKSKISDLGK